MPAVDIPFPFSNAPGTVPGEGAGRIVNCFAYKEGDAPRWRPLPGLKVFTDLLTVVANPADTLRGAQLVGSVLYAVVGRNVISVTADGTTTLLGGSVGGTGPVTIERNNALLPDITINSSRSSYIVSNGAAQSYPDGNLPQANSVAFLDGFFLWTTRSGDIWASDLNATSVNALSVVRAEARHDGLLRGVVYGQSFLAMGDDTIEVWQDVGAQPFPLQRVTVIPCGLKGQWAVAGSQDGWTEALIFVAADGSVRRLDDYTPTRISPDELERLIDAVADPATLIASVYTYGSNSFWSLSSPDWTWEYNVTTGAWHERESYGLNRWRGSLSVKAFNKWIFGDLKAADLLTIDDTGLTEAGDPLIWGLDSGPVKQFPARLLIRDASFDFILGQAPPDVDPTVLLSWSNDGGSRFGTPLSRSLGKQGRPVSPIRLHRLGLTSHHGSRARFRISDPVYTSFAGGRMTVEQRRA